MCVCVRACVCIEYVRAFNNDQRLYLPASALGEVFESQSVAVMVEGLFVMVNRDELVSIE